MGISFFDSLRLIDFLDLIIVYFIVYRAILFIRGTRALSMVFGILGLAGLYWLSSSFELFSLNWILSNFFDYFFIIIVILFQDDLRSALTKFGVNPFSPKTNRFLLADELYEACEYFQNNKMGALIAIQQKTGLRNYIETGTFIDSRVKSGLLRSIFHPESPLHDGAVIVTGNTIAAAACYLKLSQSSQLDKKYGTRHRAALGLSEESDAIVIVASEETGSISVFREGEMYSGLTPGELKTYLMEHLA